MCSKALFMTTIYTKRTGRAWDSTQPFITGKRIEKKEKGKKESEQKYSSLFLRVRLFSGLNSSRISAGIRHLYWTATITNSKTWPRQLSGATQVKIAYNQLPSFFPGRE